MVFAIGLVFIQLVVFVIFIVVAKRVISQNVTQATKHVEELNQEFVKKEEEINRKLSESEQKSQEILDKAQEEADDSRTEIMKRADSDRENIIKLARQQSQELIDQAEKSRQKLLREFDERLTKEALSKATELVQTTIPEELRQAVHTRWVQELIAQGFTHFERLHIGDDVQEVTVVTAFALQPLERTSIQNKLDTLLNRHIMLKEVVDPKVVAGISVAIGSVVLDGTLQNKIREKTKTV